MHETHWNGIDNQSPANSAENSAEAPSPPIAAEIAPGDEANQDSTPAKNRARRVFTKIVPVATDLVVRLRSGSARLPLKTEVRVGLAAIVSFSILVTFLILNRGHQKTESSGVDSKKQKVVVRDDASGKPPGTKPKPKLASVASKVPPLKRVPKPPEPVVKTPPQPTPTPERADSEVDSDALANVTPPQSTANEAKEAPESDDELVEMPPLPNTLPKTVRTEIALAIPPQGASEPKTEAGTTSDLPAPSADDEIAPPPPSTALDTPKQESEVLEPSVPEPAAEAELPPQAPSTDTELAADTPVRPKIVETPAEQPEEPKPTDIPVAEPSEPAMLVNAPTTTKSDTVESTSQEGHFEPLPISGAPLAVDNGPPRQPRTEPQPPAVVPLETPKSRDEAIEPVTHVVQRGENFWTISRLYYGSGRFYKALWAANQDQVSAPDRLFVGTTIKVPPPERLDRSRIDPVNPAQVQRAKPKSANRPPTREAADVIMMLPRGRSAPEPIPVAIPKPEKTYPYHVVKSHETLRSIARDLLNDPRRENEIRDMNLDQLGDDGDGLQIGQRLRLPEDATVRR